mmetsp:Transcript_6937/g.10758  ORF Transcript_6937/g.10758 Transcript_6937/m.10758 type:complete len:246 (-) Transcript_6937:713-1450(-)
MTPTSCIGASLASVSLAILSNPCVKPGKFSSTTGGTCVRTQNPVRILLCTLKRFLSHPIVGTTPFLHTHRVPGILTRICNTFKAFSILGPTVLFCHSVLVDTTLPTLRLYLDIRPRILMRHLHPGNLLTSRGSVVGSASKDSRYIHRDMSCRKTCRVDGRPFLSILHTPDSTSTTEILRDRIMVCRARETRKKGPFVPTRGEVFSVDAHSAAEVGWGSEIRGPRSGKKLYNIFWCFLNDRVLPLL